MDIRDRTTVRGLLAAAAAGALVLGIAACDQGKPPQSMSGGDPARQAVPPEGPKGAIAGTAEEKLKLSASPAAPSAAGDPELAGRVKAALAADPALKSMTVDVTASGTQVTLNGTADSPVNRDKATHIALNVQGVTSVQNRLVVSSGS